MIAEAVMGMPPREERTGLLLVDQLLRDRSAVLERVRTGGELAELVKTMVVTIVVGAALAGGAMGSFRGGAQIAYAAIKLPMAVLLTAVLCAPALAALGFALGRPASLVRDLALVVTALATGTLVLVALTPVLLVARAVDFDYHASILLTVGVCGVAGAAALAVLVLGVQRASARDVGIMVGAFVILFACVGAQVAWTLRPWLVRPRTPEAPFVREVEGSLYDAVLDTVRSARGDYVRERAPLPEEDGAP